MNTSFYKYLVFGLVALNISILAFFLLTKPSHPGPGPRPHSQINSLQKDLNLDEEQLAKFEILRDGHQKEMKNKSEEQKKVLAKYFSASNKQIISDSLLLDSFLNLERQKLVATQKHFDDIKNLLRNDQINLFDVSKERLMRRITGRENQRPKRN